MLNKYKSRQLQAKVKFSFWFFIQAVKEPFRGMIKPMGECHRMAMRTGDVEVSETAAEAFRFVPRKD